MQDEQNNNNNAKKGIFLWAFLVSTLVIIFLVLQLWALQTQRNVFQNLPEEMESSSVMDFITATKT